ncbi:MAG: RluA family pseudouridine synthase [Spirochaetales bacterium]|nr:RluA family pseudouridine synthase [Spirochaetales bacterium]
MPSETRKKIELQIADEQVQGLRLDRFIAENLKIFTRNQIGNHDVEAWVNQKKVKLSKKVSSGDHIEITYTAARPVTYEPEKMDLDILYEDGNVVVVNKPQGMVVHPAAGNRTGTLAQGLLYLYKELRETFDEDEARPGIVHRLDKDTSGVIIVAKHPRAQNQLASQFRRKKAFKKYYAVVRGSLVNSSGSIESYIVRDRRNRQRFAVSEHEGRLALTNYRLLKSWADYAFVALMPVTGRTHQLRVHMKHLNHPILGDAMYSRKDNRFPEAGLMLHAYSLSILLPGEEAPRTFRAPLPQHFKETLKKITSLQARDS